MDLFGTATLRHPAWYSDSVFDERALSLSVGDYKITPGVGHDGRCLVTDSKGATVYNGIGPVTVVAAQ